VQVAPGVELGAGADLQAPCVVGKAPRGAREGELQLRIGCQATVRPFTTIYAGSVIGDRLQTGQGASIREETSSAMFQSGQMRCGGNKIGDRADPRLLPRDK
jgi:UDP-3-O-[3-hydroxymyristoyl] glucosamine N-acyltransferase